MNPIQRGVSEASRAATAAASRTAQPAGVSQERAAPGAKAATDSFEAGSGTRGKVHAPSSYGIQAYSGYAPTVVARVDGGGSFNAPGVQAGKPLTVSYTPDVGRLGRVATTLETVRVHFRIEGGAIEHVDLPAKKDPVTGEARFDAATLPIPQDARGQLEYWFEALTDQGESLWDSNNGANFRAQIVPAGGGVLEFEAGGSQRQHGTLRAGGALNLAYDPERVRGPLGDGWYKMGPTFGATAYVSFDGKPAQEIRLTHYADQQLQAFMPAVAIPEDAQKVSVWFQGTTVGASEWDSNQGQNFSFDIAPKEG